MTLVDSQLCTVYTHHFLYVLHESIRGVYAPKPSEALNLPSALNESGPNISSGVVKRVNNLWKKNPPHKSDKRRPNSDLAVPGGPGLHFCLSWHSSK